MAVMGMSADATGTGNTPGWTPPKADVSPEKLRAFLFYLARDLAPVGYIEHAMAMAHSVAQKPSYEAYPELAEMVDRWSRELAFDPRLHGTLVSG